MKIFKTDENDSIDETKKRRFTIDERQPLKLQSNNSLKRTGNDTVEERSES